MTCRLWRYLFSLCACILLVCLFLFFVFVCLFFGGEGEGVVEGGGGAPEIIFQISVYII